MFDECLNHFAQDCGQEGRQFGDKNANEAKLELIRYDSPIALLFPKKGFLFITALVQTRFLKHVALFGNTC